MKHVPAVVFLVAVIAIVLYVECEMAMQFGLGLLLIPGFGLAVITVALAGAPLGYDGEDAFYICRSPRPATHIPRYRFSHLIRVRP